MSMTLIFQVLENKYTSLLDLLLEYTRFGKFEIIDISNFGHKNTKKKCVKMRTKKYLIKFKIESTSRSSEI